MILFTNTLRVKSLFLFWNQSGFTYVDSVMSAGSLDKEITLIKCSIQEKGIPPLSD